MDNWINSSAKTSQAAIADSVADSANTEVTHAMQHPSLAILWARQYLEAVNLRRTRGSAGDLDSLEEANSREGRQLTATKLRHQLNLASAKAWSQAEQLLSETIRTHAIHADLINPLKIASDSSQLFQQALTSYQDGVSPYHLSVQIGQMCGQIRQHYTVDDPRAIGIFSMQFHYTGKALLDELSVPEQALFEPYLKVMDDHMYMPLQAAYNAAAQQDFNSPTLQAVQALLPISTEIAQAVCDQVVDQWPDYECYSGPLNSSAVRISSVRDVEMFQIYLCLCTLENSIRSVQQELFPLCAMLYPPLRVEWSLVQAMLKALSWEMLNRLKPDQVSLLLPYLRVLTDLFSNQVFE